LLKIHSEYILSDIMVFSTKNGSYGAVMLVDVLEHLEKDEGLTLLARMSRWATRKVIVMVPNGFVSQDDTYGDGNTRQRHLSGWTPQEFQQLGYRVRGFHGWKPLRGEAGNIIPTKTKAGHYLFAGISWVSEPVVQAFPTLAYHLFAVLNLKTK